MTYMTTPTKEELERTQSDTRAAFVEMCKRVLHVFKTDDYRVTVRGAVTFEARIQTGVWMTAEDNQTALQRVTAALEQEAGDAWRSRDRTAKLIRNSPTAAAIYDLMRYEYAKQQERTDV